MDANVNVLEILINQQVPAGTKFWSELFGEVEYSGWSISDKGERFVLVLDRVGLLRIFCSNGFRIGECTSRYQLYPSATQRDWLKYKYMHTLTGDKHTEGV